MKEDKNDYFSLFLYALTLIFIVLKLTKYISWSWVWILCPLWIPIAFVLLLFVFSFIGTIFKNINNSKDDDKWMGPNERLDMYETFKDNEEMFSKIWTGGKDDV